MAMQTSLSRLFWSIRVMLTMKIRIRVWNRTECAKTCNWRSQGRRRSSMACLSRLADYKVTKTRCLPWFQGAGFPFATWIHSTANYQALRIMAAMEKHTLQNQRRAHQALLAREDSRTQVLLFLKSIADATLWPLSFRIPDPLITQLRLNIRHI